MWRESTNDVSDPVKSLTVCEQSVFLCEAEADNDTFTVPVVCRANDDCDCGNVDRGHDKNSLTDG